MTAARILTGAALTLSCFPQGLSTEMQVPERLVDGVPGAPCSTTPAVPWSEAKFLSVAATCVLLFGRFVVLADGLVRSLVPSGDKRPAKTAETLTSSGHLSQTQRSCGRVARLKFDGPSSPHLDW